MHLPEKGRRVTGDYRAPSPIHRLSIECPVQIHGRAMPSLRLSRISSMNDAG